MKLVFLSNYYNHHQSEFSEEMYRILNGEFYFIACEQIDEERKNMGWGMKDFPSFVYQYDENESFCIEMIESADVVIIGSAPKTLITNRLKRKKMTLIYSERIDKCKLSLIQFLKSFIALNVRYGLKENVFLLCASAFTAYDYSKRLLFKNKCYKWGYFPVVINYPKKELIEKKSVQFIELLYVSRFIKVKHPELPILVAKQLKEDNISFHLTLIGDGELKDEIVNMVNYYKLSKEVTFIDSMSPEKVREYMVKSNVFLFTSDRGEGWGAVLNESMNSGCAIVASSEIGSVPYLIDDGKNGLIYQDGNFNDLYNKVYSLCINNELRESLGLEAFQTVKNIWNADIAAQRLCDLIGDLQKTGFSNSFDSGPCSKANIIKDGWYKC